MNARVRSSQRGTTLLEALVGMAILLVGSSAAMTANQVGLRMGGDARRTTRAAAIAQDLVENMALWDFDDARLTDGDHPESALTLAGAVWIGLSADEVRAAGFLRSWSVRRVDDLDGDGEWDAARLTITITYPSGTTLTVYSIKRNPQEI